MRDEYVEKLARRVTEQVLLGDPFDDGTTMGPVNNEQVAAKMDEHVADAVDRGASVVAGGERAGGFPTELYWQATILADVPADARVATEETFGPVAPVVAIASLEEAIKLTNASPYGLLAAIFTADLDGGLQFAERVRTGWSTSTSPRTTGRATSPSAGARAPTAASAASAASRVEQFTELQTIVIG